MASDPNTTYKQTDDLIPFEYCTTVRAVVATVDNEFFKEGS